MHASMVKPQDAVIVSVLAAVLALGLTLASPDDRRYRSSSVFSLCWWPSRRFPPRSSC